MAADSHQASAFTQNLPVEAKQWLTYAVYAANLLIIGFLWWRGSHLEYRTLHGVLTILGRLTGLISAYASLWQLLLIGRMPILKRAFGMEKELHLHRWNGYAAIGFLLAHIVFSTAGYALTLHVNVAKQFVDFVVNYDDVLQATVGSVLMIGLVIMSVVIIRRHFKYETWYLVHLSSYLAIVLGFGHQLSIGTDFIKQPGFTQYWWVLYLIVFGLIAVFRFILPVAESLWQGFRIERVEAEADQIYSIYISGRHLDKFNHEAGQFAIWRFLSGPLAWQGHPFSISSRPGEAELRVTFKNVGDFTNQLKTVKSGARVILEGPFGNFSWSRAKTNKVLMIAGGIGLTPLISMVSDQSALRKDIHLIYAVRNHKDIAFRNELQVVSQAANVKLTYLIEEPSSKGVGGRLDRQKLFRLVPDFKTREVFLCGPPPMMEAVQSLLEEEGIPQNRIYTERFAF